MEWFIAGFILGVFLTLAYKIIIRVRNKAHLTLKISPPEEQERKA